MKSLFLGFLIFISGILSMQAGQISFDIQDINEEGNMLFSADTGKPAEYSNFLFLYNITGQEIFPVTINPEIVNYIESSGEVQIQNYSGLYRLKLEPGDGGIRTVRNLSFYSSFAADSSYFPYGGILPVSVSPDGKWCVLQEKNNDFFGTLTLVNTENGEKRTVSDKIILNYNEPPAIWSPDSRFLIYSQDNKLYFISVKSEITPEQDFRYIGEGRLNCVKWASEDSLYYIKNRIIKLIRPAELIAYSYYPDSISRGTNAGKLPFNFNYNTDEFYISPDHKKIIILKDHKTVILLPAGMPSGEESSAGSPLLSFNRDINLGNIWWETGDSLVLSVKNIFPDGGGLKLFRLESDYEGSDSFSVSDVTNLYSGNTGPVMCFEPSADGTKVVIAGSDYLKIIESGTDDCKNLKISESEKLLWISKNRIVVFGRYSVRIVDIENLTDTLIALSGCGSASFTPDGSGIIAESGGGLYKINIVTDRNTYGFSVAELSGSAELEHRTQTDKYRVFLENPDNSFYGNYIMLRTAGKDENVILFPYPVRNRKKNSDDNPEPYDSVNTDIYFNHGSRTQNNRISLVYNCIDSDEGINRILSVLDKYGIYATFFINGDFLRNNPVSSAAIAESGNECGSLFYTYMDMADFRYKVNKDFIVKGLARLEDEFYRITGKEVSTFWHAPWYVISPSVLAATEEMNYYYAGRDIDPESFRLSGSMGADEITLKVIEKAEPGSIIPFRVGGDRCSGEGSYQNIEILINGLLNKGFSMVPVSAMVEHKSINGIK